VLIQQQPAEVQAAVAAAAPVAAAADQVLAADIPGMQQNSPASLPADVPLEPPAEVLVAHVQVDQPNVANGGIQFFGTQTAPQVVQEDGSLTPPAPPAGSGLPIPPAAITVISTFIGQPGGTTFNAPDVAIPVVLTPLPATLASIPGAEALNQAFVAVANVGNDMSPITRKKAKKLLVVTTAIAVTTRRI
jgi:hypothetical protein